MTKNMKLQIDDIRKAYDEKQVLKGASFTFETGKIYGLLGRNGSGKTTLFDCLNEDLKVDGGTFIIQEEDGQKRKIISEDNAYVIATPTIPEFLTGREFLKFFLDINEDKIKENKSIDEYFEMVRINVEDRDKLLRDYSYGMKNKMQMLVSVIANPSVLLLDEPLTSFDVVVADEMKNWLRSIKKDRIIIFSTHIMDLALDLCDEIVLLHQGVLSEVEKEQQNTDDFKNRIINMLKGDSNV